MGACGIVVLHFSPQQIRSEPGMVIGIIKAALRNVRTEPIGLRTLPAGQ